MKLHQIQSNRSMQRVLSATPGYRAVILAGLCAGGVQSAAFANTERDLDSHEHGAANINVVIDESTVFVELESPWNNLVGFEHSPSTESQHEAVDGAMETLADPASLFAFNDGAGCQAGAVTIESTLDAEGGHDDHDDHKEDGHDNHDDHEEHGHDDHGEDDHDDHADHGHGEETHSEVLAMYEFNCENTGKLESIEVKLFDLFDGFSDIDYQAAGPSGQVGNELSPSNSVVDLSGVR